MIRRFDFLLPALEQTITEREVELVLPSLVERLVCGAHTPLCDQTRAATEYPRYAARV